MSQDSQPTVSFAVMVVFCLCLFLCSPRHKQQIRPNNSRSLLCHDCDTNQQPWEPLTQFQHQILHMERRLQPSAAEWRKWPKPRKKKETETSPANISEINMEMSSAEKVCSELRPTAPVCVSVHVCVWHSVRSCLRPIGECHKRPGPWKVGSREGSHQKNL